MTGRSLAMRRGREGPRRLWLAAALLLAAAAPAPRPEVSTRLGDLWGDAQDGRGARRLSLLGDVSGATLSPDGRRIAYVRIDAKAKPGDDADATSLWVCDMQGGKAQRLLAPHPFDGDPTHELMGFEAPVWSLDGGFVYVLSAGWATSEALHQVNVATHAERFVTAANSVAVVRNGPYRGLLLVSRHKYYPGPAYGSYNPVDLMRPDGRLVLTIPGSARDEGEPSVANWLKAHGWTAS